MVGTDATGNASIDEEGLARDVVCEVEEGAAGGSGVYNPMKAAPFPGS